MRIINISPLQSANVKNNVYKKKKQYGKLQIRTVPESFLILGCAKQLNCNHPYLLQLNQCRKQVGVYLSHENTPICKFDKRSTNVDCTTVFFYNLSTWEVNWLFQNSISQILSACSSCAVNLFFLSFMHLLNTPL